MDTTIGYIGLGSIGLGMARNLIEGGFAVIGYDARPEALEALVEDGGERAGSPAQAAEGADLLAVCVFNAGQVEEVLFGPEGAVPALPRGATVMLHTTMAPAAVRALEERLAGTGHLLVDAPVTGGKSGADLGTLTVIASGSDPAFEAASPAFEAVGRHVYRVGERAGAGSTVKMVNQLLVGVHTVAAVEAMTLAVKAGADPNVVYDVITHGAGNSVSFKTRIPSILERDFDPRGVVEILTKDLGIVSEVAAALGVDVPMAQAALTQYQAAVESGLGQLDSTAVVKVYEARAGVDIAGAAEDEPAD